MRLLDRYLFREFLTPFTVCLVGIQGLVVFITIFSDLPKIQDAKLHLLETIEYATAASLGLLTIVLPISLLLGLLWALTHHSRNNEITAMRAAGISLWRICLPYFIIAIILGGVLFALNESLIPRGTDFAEHLLDRSTGSAKAEGRGRLDFANQRDNRLWMANLYQPATSELTGVIITWSQPDGFSYELHADSAKRIDGVWTFFNAQELVKTNAPHALLVPELITNTLAMPNFDETPREFQEEIKINNYLDHGKHNPNIPLKYILPYLQTHPYLSRGERGRLLTELHERIAMPLICIVVPLIAIPFAAAPGRRNLFFGVAGSVFIFFAYYILQQVGGAFGISGSWPAWLAAWLPNLFFGVLGLILMIRIR
jgi:lipopolysaccharide export system permease protein